ncbi:hypothetical protein [Kribbella italica]|uniref:Uncharacterized protein n=1 Tax=Kribbella italica TaxID=1540520 RepID=A0A7W9MSU9_9ACTN|nr:hypothetical protein [Kribbella italica]MBB5834542.1 hypothetical protein [Kribbella italica]
MLKAPNRLWTRREAALAELAALPRVPAHGDLLLASTLSLDKLVDAFGDPAVRRGAVLVAAFTAASRAAWSLGQPEPGEHVRRLVELEQVVYLACDQASWNAV